jgi:catechol 2,3-dioxygenase-like lactoylglutathione lyase family enzyme
MGLSDNPVTASVAVSDVARAKEFYESKLGLSSGRAQPDGGRTYDCSGGTKVHVYPSPGYTGGSGATVAWWEVDDLEGTVDELTSKGVTFEQYGEPFNTDAKGIARLGDLAAAWFKDPDGNILAIGTQ